MIPYFTLMLIELSAIAHRAMGRKVKQEGAAGAAQRTL